MEQRRAQQFEDCGAVAEFWYFGTSLWLLAQTHPFGSVAYYQEALGSFIVGALLLSLLLLATRKGSEFAGVVVSWTALISCCIWLYRYLWLYQWKGQVVADLTPLWVGAPYFGLWLIGIFGAPPPQSVPTASTAAAAAGAQADPSKYERLNNSGPLSDSSAPKAPSLDAASSETILVVKRGIWSALLFSVTSAGFAYGLYYVHTGPPPLRPRTLEKAFYSIVSSPFGLIAVAMFCCLALVHLGRLLNRNPVILISKDGLMDYRVLDKPVPWNAIREVREFTIKQRAGFLSSTSTHFVVALKQPLTEFQQATRPARKRGTAMTSGPDEVAIDGNYLNVTVAQIREAIAKGFSG